jgi:hypothetical protein
MSMRKNLSLSALLSGLLATPLLAAAQPRPEPAAGTEIPAIVPAPYADSPAEVLAAQLPNQFFGHMRLLVNGQPLNTYGMQDLNRRIAEDMQWRLSQLLAQGRGVATVDVQFAAPSHVAQRTEQAAYLGVSAAPVPPVLRDQISTPRGMGMLVEYVEKDSPADVAGIRVHDVLERIDDQWVINSQQLAVLVRNKRPGDTVAITLLRGGKELALNAKLAEKELPVLEALQDAPGMYAPSPFGGVGGLAPLPRAQANSLNAPLGPRAASVSVRAEADGRERRTLLDDGHDITILKDKSGNEQVTVKDRAGRLLYDGPAANLNANVPGDVVGKVNELRQKSAKIQFEQEPVGENAKSVSLSRSDSEHQITIRADDRGRTLAVKELATGRMLFDGPYRGDEDLRDLPGPVLEKVKALASKVNLAPERPGTQTNQGL